MSLVEFVPERRTGAYAVDDGFELGKTRIGGVRRRFQHNEELFGQGEQAAYVYVVASGAVRTIQYSADGRRQILGFHYRGDVIGLELGARHGFAAEAVTDGEVILTRRSIVDQAVAADGDAARALLQRMADQVDRTRAHMLVLGMKGAGERVAAFLLDMHDRLGDAEFDLPMSRADIADHLALTVETVSRAFTRMERERAIALPSSRHVVLRNRAALESLQAAA